MPTALDALLTRGSDALMVGILLPVAKIRTLQDRTLPVAISEMSDRQSANLPAQSILGRLLPDVTLFDYPCGQNGSSWPRNDQSPKDVSNSSCANNRALIDSGFVLHRVDIFRPQKKVYLYHFLLQDCTADLAPAIQLCAIL